MKLLAEKTMFIKVNQWRNDTGQWETEVGLVVDEGEMKQAVHQIFLFYSVIMFSPLFHTPVLFVYNERYIRLNSSINNIVTRNTTQCFCLVTNTEYLFQFNLLAPELFFKF